MIDPIAIVRDKCNGADQKTVAAEMKISPQYLNDLIKGRKEAGPAVLKALGLVKVVTYRKRRGQK